MYIDNTLVVSDAQAVTADAYGSAVASIDLGAAGLNIGAGNPLCFVVTVDVAADSTTGDETYAFEVHQSAASNMGTPDTLLVRTIAAADLTAGSKHIIPVPSAISKRYINLYYNVGGTTPTITVTADLKPLNMVDDYKSYPNGYTIS